MRMTDTKTTASEFGKMGGKMVLDKYGKEYFKRLAAKRFEGMTKEQISEYMTRISHARASVQKAEAARKDQ